MATTYSVRQSQWKLKGHSQRHQTPLYSCHRTSRQLHRSKKQQRCVYGRWKQQSAWDTSPSPSRAPETTSGTAVVVGAGVSGILSALELARFGMNVQVYDQRQIRQQDPTATCLTPLTSSTIGAMAGMGINIRGQAFSDTALLSTQARVMDCEEVEPAVLKQAEAELYTTYNQLRLFLLDEVERLVPGRIVYHGLHALMSEADVDINGRTVTFATAGGPVRQPYDVLIGADGSTSQVRLAMVKADRTVASQVSWLAPMRYVSATNLSKNVHWPSEASARMVSALNAEDVAQAGLTTSAERATLPTPLTFIGHPPALWGHSRYFKIKLTLFEDPAARGTYVAMFEGSTHLFEDLNDVLDKTGPQALAASVHEMFLQVLPTEWTAAIAAAFAMKPAGYSRSGTVMCAKLASPQKVPGVAIVGDAGFATTWRLGRSLETAVGAAAALGWAMRNSEKLSDALQHFSEQAPMFLGEHCNAGLLKYFVQVAVTCRVLVHRALTFVGLGKLAPHPSYLAALRAAASFQDVCKWMQKEIAYVSIALGTAMFCVGRLAWIVYRNNRYLMV